MRAKCLQNGEQACITHYCICYFAMNLAKAVFNRKIARFCGKPGNKRIKKLNYTLCYPPSYKLMWITIKYRFIWCAIKNYSVYLWDYPGDVSGCRVGLAKLTLIFSEWYNLIVKHVIICNESSQNNLYFILVHNISAQTHKIHNIYPEGIMSIKIHNSGSIN